MNSEQNKTKKKLGINGKRLSIIAGVLTSIAAICAILGFSLFRSFSVFEDTILIPDSQTGVFKEAGDEDLADEISAYDFLVEVDVRIKNDDDKTWRHFVDANVGDVVEFRIQYRNVSRQRHENVMIKNELADNLIYVENSTIAYNANHPYGTPIDEPSGVITSGINIGSYDVRSNAFVQFSAIVADKNLQYGRNMLYIWSQAGVKGITSQDYACVFVQLDK